MPEQISIGFIHQQSDIEILKHSDMSGYPILALHWIPRAFTSSLAVKKYLLFMYLDNSLKLQKMAALEPGRLGHKCQKVGFGVCFSMKEGYTKEEESWISLFESLTCGFLANCILARRTWMNLIRSPEILWFCTVYSKWPKLRERPCKDAKIFGKHSPMGTWAPHSSSKHCTSSKTNCGMEPHW